MAPNVFQATGPGITPGKPNVFDALKPLTQQIAAGYQQRQALKRETAQQQIEFVAGLADKDPELAAAIIDHIPDEVFAAAGYDKTFVSGLRGNIAQARGAQQQQQPPAAAPAAGAPTAPATPTTPEPNATPAVGATPPLAGTTTAAPATAPAPNVRMFRPRTAAEQQQSRAVEAGIGATTAAAAANRATAERTRGVESRDAQKFGIAQETDRIAVESARLGLAEQRTKFVAGLVVPAGPGGQPRKLTNAEQAAVFKAIDTGQPIPAKFAVSGELQAEVDALVQLGVGPREARDLVIEPHRLALDAARIQAEYGPQIAQATLEAQLADKELSKRKLDLLEKQLAAGPLAGGENAAGLLSNWRNSAEAASEAKRKQLGPWTSRNPSTLVLRVAGEKFEVARNPELLDIMSNGVADLGAVERELIAWARNNGIKKSNLSIADFEYKSPGDMTAEKNALTYRGSALLTQIVASRQAGVEYLQHERTTTALGQALGLSPEQATAAAQQQDDSGAFKQFDAGTQALIDEATNLREQLAAE